MTASNPSQPLAISGALLIDGTGRPPLAEATVVIEDGRVIRVGPSPATPVPAGAQVMDGRGRFLIPGLTAMHVHVQGPDRQHSALFLAAGVTTVLDLRGQMPDLLAHRAAIESGKTLGPRLYFTGPLLEETEPFPGFAHLSQRIDAARIEDEVDTPSCARRSPRLPPQRQRPRWPAGA